MTLLKGPNIQLVPFDSSEDWTYLAQWFYDVAYVDMWRHHPKMMSKQDFQHYPQIINGQVFMIAQGFEKIGFIQMIPDCKTNRGFYMGILISQEHQKKHFSHEAFLLLMDYAFNRLDYNKAIIEILASNTQLKQGLTQGGCLFEGTHYKEAFMDGEFVDELRFSMSADFFNKKHKQVVNLWVDSYKKRQQPEVMQ